MRLAALPIVVLAGAAAAGDRTGHVVRVEQPAAGEIYVPAGDFWMGLNDYQHDGAIEDCREQLEPGDRAAPLSLGSNATLCDLYALQLDAMTGLFKVTTSAYAIDRTEVTVAAYRKCIAAGACPLDPLIDGDERYIRDEWPIVNITWDEAQTYCRWRGGRLPTEAEWERAARGDDRVDGEAGQWPWGTADRPHDFNHGKPRGAAMRNLERGRVQFQLDLMGDPDDSDGALLIAPPGSYPWGEGARRAGRGTLDQAGNVAEWTADTLGTKDETRGFKNMPGCIEIDDEGRHIRCVNPHRDGKDGEPRVVRGGSWRQPAFLGRANLRDPYNELLYASNRRFSHIGFRCVRPG
jgi:formylglycine-generating enzyme required for sulfatase activity